MSKIEAEIEALQTKLKQKQALLKKQQAQKLAEERKQARTIDTRRKILTGAVVLKKAETDPDVFVQLKSWLEEGLTEERDRALFPGLGAGKGS